jgi:hypothetical protein
MATWQAETAVPAIFASEQSGALAPQALAPQPWIPSGVDASDTVAIVEHRAAPAGNEWTAEEAAQAAGTFDWFEDFHVVARVYSFGNLLSAQSADIEVFSAYRYETRTWDAFVTIAGSGITLGSAPALPTVVLPLTGYLMTLEIDTTGSPVVDGALAFEFEGGDVATVLVELQRIVLWWLDPEQPFAEELESLTDIIPIFGGREQRIALRKNPRQFFPYEYLVEEGATRQILENLLFDWQARVFGVPVWWDELELTAAATAGDTSITVDETAYRDLRVGGLAVLLVDREQFDVLTISAIGGTSMTFESGLLNSYSVGTRVFPLQASKIDKRIGGSRYPVGMGRMQIAFRTLDNDVNLADLTPFSSYSGKLLLDVFNIIRSSTVSEDFEINVYSLDSETGLEHFEGEWDRHKRSHAFVMRAEGRQAVWEMRGMVHALRGRQVSLYIPRASDDLVVTADLLNTSVQMQVANYGYAQFVRNRQPKNVIRVTLANGTTLVRTIVGSSNIDADSDQLEVDVAWPSTIDYTTIERVEFVEEVRASSDRVKIEYQEGGNVAHLVMPLIATFE